MSDIEINIQTICLNSLMKVFPDEAPDTIHYSNSTNKGTALLNEAYSFQIAYCSEHLSNVKVTVESELSQFISIYEVGLVPAEYPAPEDHEGDFLRTAPGLFPDPLYQLEQGCAIIALPGQWRSIWVEVNPKGMARPGNYPITVSFVYDDDVKAAEETYTLELIDAMLPEQSMPCINWFHADCLSSYYKTDVFSEFHWELIGRFMENAVEHGIDTILTPVFTPPLDTEEGKERPTVQLVDVMKDGEKYKFCFKKLKRWINLCREKKVRNLEISHLFTQWGALHAPKIIAEVNGEKRRIFGWETDAFGDEYRNFLTQLLPELIRFIKENCEDMKVFFHISDEPLLEHIENYRKARSIMAYYVKDFTIIDALSNYEFYKFGLISVPVVSNDHIETFIENGVPDLWAYYCCGQYKGVSNRFIAMPASRNRIIGYQLFKYNIAGFLHWGYNFWYSRLSRKEINPYLSTDADKGFPAGDPFVVYPGDDGHPIASTRLKVFREALQDMRALQLLERLAGREHALELLDKGNDEPLTFSRYPRDPHWLPDKRESINMEIRKIAEGSRI